MLDVAIGIPTFRRPDKLAALLAELPARIAEVGLERPVRILVVDNDPSGSARAVAQAAGVSKRTLYARHSTKEALRKSVVEDRVQRWSSEASAGNADLPEQFSERLKRYAQILMASLGNPEVRQFDRLILTTASRFPEIAQSFYQIGYSYELQFLTNEIVAGTKDDPVPPVDPERAARQLLSMIQGWRRTEETIREVSGEEAARFAADAVDVLLRGRAGW